MLLRSAVRLRPMRRTISSRTLATISRCLFPEVKSVSRCFSARPVTEIVRERVARGELQLDVAQERAARRLSRLQEALDGYCNHGLIDDLRRREEALEEQAKEEKESQAKRRSSAQTAKSLEPAHAPVAVNSHTPTPDPALAAASRIPRGLYIYGEVGTGKSMLMDTFFQESPITKKRRVHFHAFLQEVHQRIHALKQKDLAEKGRSFHVDTSVANNPIVRVAQGMASEVTLLCFDEFQVTDVADALILSQLFSTLFQHGTVVVATSNRPPTDLYEGGINRSYFLPFIDLLSRHCIVHELKSTLDYRLLLSDKDMNDLFIVDDDPDFAASSCQINEVFDKLMNGVEPVSLDLPVAFNRTLHVERAHPDGLVGCFTFQELCQRELGSAEYRGLAQHFQIVIVERIPVLTLKEHDQARRFITLVDELYENKCALVCSAVKDPQSLFVGKDSIDQVKPDPNSMETKVGEAFGIDVAQSSGRTMGELASVQELSFAFRRAGSRLIEMSSQRWWDQILLLEEEDDSNSKHREQASMRVGV